MEERLFDDRERGFEAQFAHEQEMAFRMQARRDKLFGLWVAERLGKRGAAAQTYATAFVTLSARQERDRAVIAKAVAELAAASAPVDEPVIRAAFAQCALRARAEVPLEPRPPLG
jgi:hypothetical protein